MKDIDFIQISLIALLVSLLFLAFGVFGLLYDGFCDVIGLERYYAVCFGMAFLCFVTALVCLIVESLTK